MSDEKTNDQVIAERADKLGNQGTLAYPTPLQLKVLETIISEGNHFITACRACGVTWDTFQGWRDRGSRGDPSLADFMAMLDRAEAACEREALRIVMECANQGKVKSLKKFWIKLKGKDGEVNSVPAVEEREDDNPDRWKAAAWVLEQRFGERFSRMRRLQHSGALTNRQVIVLEDEDDESLELTVFPKDSDEPHALPAHEEDPEAGADGDE